jgi:2-phospho-L-lactate guanylyltransferase
MLTMLQDVLAVLRQVEELRPVLVVTPDPHAVEVAEDFGARVLCETESRGHSAAAISGFAEARANGAVRALTLPADAPLVTTKELRTLLRAGPPPSSASRRAMSETTAQVTLVPSHDRDGTNAILVSPPGAFDPSFGPGSFARHQSLARDRGAACRTVHLAGLAMDVDEPGDLLRLMQAKRGDPRYAFLDTHCMHLLETTDRA